MTIDEINDLCNSLYPTIDSLQTRVMYMNMAQRELSPYFDTEVMASDLTEANVDEYPLPTGCTDISQIISLGISRTVTTASDRYDYTYYHKSTPDDFPNDGYCYYQVVNSAGTKKLVIYPKPTLANYPMAIKFKKPLTTLVYTTATQVPDFDATYHHLLAFYVCKWLAAKGDTPDTTQADYFSQEWESGKDEIFGAYMQKQIRSPKKRKDNRQWHSGKRFAGGGAAPTP